MLLFCLLFFSYILSFSSITLHINRTGYAYDSMAICTQTSSYRVKFNLPGVLYDIKSNICIKLASLLVVYLNIQYYVRNANVLCHVEIGKSKNRFVRFLSFCLVQQCWVIVGKTQSISPFRWAGASICFNVELTICTWIGVGVETNTQETSKHTNILRWFGWQGFLFLAIGLFEYHHFIYS